MPASAPRSIRTALRKVPHHYITLLIAELIFILVYPFFIGTEFRDELFRLFAVLVFCAALYAVLGRGRVTALAFFLGLPAIGLHLLNVTGRFHFTHLPTLILGVVFLIYISGVFVWSIVSDPSVTTDTLAGAVSAYFLIGITFGLVYSLIEQLMPGSFKDTIQPGKNIHQSEFVFFSFVTLTTVGYGDIVPWGAHARSVAIVEAVIGIMYPAVLISRLVGMHGSKRDSSKS